VAVNCGALPETLIESELFGARKGAFSGASEERGGLVRAADGGTLFLDEIAELSASSQVALLRVLQERQVVPVGGTKPVDVDVRFIAATHQDLEERIADGRFREDLYARVTGFEITLPPLRERLEDLGLLTAAILDDAVPGGASKVRFSRTVARALLQYDWPRNIRELSNALESALLVAKNERIELEHLPASVQACFDRTPQSPLDLRHPDALRVTLVDLLARHHGNVAAVARALGKKRQQVHRWNRQLGIDPNRFRA
jgi:transcriptional regulator with PAS, ATPase and Fis domain